MSEILVVAPYLDRGSQSASHSTEAISNAVASVEKSGHIVLDGTMQELYEQQNIPKENHGLAISIVRKLTVANGVLALVDDSDYMNGFIDEALYRGKRLVLAGRSSDVLSENQLVAIEKLKATFTVLPLAGDPFKI